jgi:hypothetical protein
MQGLIDSGTRTIVQSLERSELLCMPFRDLSEPDEEFPALCARAVETPDGVEGFLGGLIGSR